MTVFNVLLSVLLLVIVPILLGYSAEGIFKKKTCTIGRMYVIGSFVMYAFFQLLCVPMVFMKVSFHLMCMIVSAVYIAIILAGIIQHRTRIVKRDVKFENVWDILLFLGMLLVIIFVIRNLIVYTHIDDDDARFVVNAVDMVRTDRMFRTNPATGKAMEWEGELKKDIVSPWAAYQAYAAKFTMIHPTVMCHMVLPLATYLNLFLIQWMLSLHYVGEKTSYRSLFCIFIWIASMYMGYGDWSAEGFTLLRIWQGKAVVAGVGIPMLNLLFFEAYEEEEPSVFWVLLITNTALCLFSNMGILLGAVFTCCFGFIYGLLKKNWKLMLSLILAAVPDGFYLVLRLFV